MKYKYKLGKVEVIKENETPVRLSVFVHCQRLDDADEVTAEVHQEYIFDKADVPQGKTDLPTEDQVKTHMKEYLAEVVVPAQPAKTRLDQLIERLPVETIA